MEGGGFHGSVLEESGRNVSPECLRRVCVRYPKA